MVNFEGTRTTVTPCQKTGLQKTGIHVFRHKLGIGPKSDSVTVRQTIDTGVLLLDGHHLKIDLSLFKGFGQRQRGHVKEMIRQWLLLVPMDRVPDFALGALG